MVKKQDKTFRLGEKVSNLEKRMNNLENITNGNAKVLSMVVAKHNIVANVLQRYGFNTHLSIWKRWEFWYGVMTVGVVGWNTWNYMVPDIQNSTCPAYDLGIGMN